MYQWLKSGIASLIIRPYAKEYTKGILINNDCKNSGFIRKTVNVPKRFSLDTVHIPPKIDQKQNLADQIVVIKVSSNATPYEHNINNYFEEVMQHNYHIICFNYPNVGSTTSTAKISSTQDWVDCVKAQVDACIKLGADPEKIYIDGRSIGGAFAMIAAAQLHKKDIKVNAYSRFSFSQLSMVAAHTFFRLAKDITGFNLQTNITFSIVFTIVHWTLKLFNLEIDAETAYHSIPEDYKDYCVIKTKGKIKIQNNITDDLTIGSRASLHAVLKTTRSSTIKMLKLLSEGISTPFTKDEKNEWDKIRGVNNIIRHAQNARNNGISAPLEENRQLYHNLLKKAAYLAYRAEHAMRERKLTLFGSSYISANAHNTSITHFKTRTGNHYNQPFLDFIEGSTEQHQHKGYCSISDVGTPDTKNC